MRDRRKSPCPYCVNNTGKKWRDIPKIAETRNSFVILSCGRLVIIDKLEDGSLTQRDNCTARNTFCPMCGRRVR